MEPVHEIYVLDGHNLLYKAHFVFFKHPLINKKNRDVSVCYGFIRMLLGLLKERQPTHLAIAFDRKAPTFRHELYKEYKMQRPPMPAPIADNIPDIRNIISAFGISILEQDGYEADDLLGTIVRKFESTDVRISLVTGDKDMMHLIGPNVRVLAAKKGLSDFDEYNREKVIEKYGVPPEQMVDYFSIVGDAIDNVPGIAGVGPVGAVKLLKIFHTLENLLTNFDRIESEKLRAKIIDSREMALLSKKLIELKRDANIPDDLDYYKIKEPDNTKIRQLFSDLEFHSLANEIGIPASQSAALNYSLLNRKEDLLELTRRIRQKKSFAFHIETAGDPRFDAKLLGIAFSIGEGEAVFAAAPSSGSPADYTQDQFVSLIHPVFSDPSIAKSSHDIKRATMQLMGSGISLKGPLFDTMIASYILDPGRHHHTLNELSVEFLSREIHPFDIDALTTGGALLIETPPENFVQSECESALAISELAAMFEFRLKQNGLHGVYSKIEMPLIQPLLRMELAGVRIDSEFLQTLSRDLEQKLLKIAETVYILAGEEFNINSTQQLAKILFTKLGYPTKGIKKTKSGYSTSESELQKLVMLGGLFSELPTKLLEYRSMYKIKSTYSDALPLLVNRKTGRLHTQFNQTIAETGRLSSSEPNLQNIPIRTELGREIRKAFIPAEGGILLSADYSQMELRILAHIAEDEAMIEAFQQNQDIHASTASALFRVPIGAVTAEQRRRAKTVNFGIDYGMTAFGLSERLGISVREAQAYIEQYLGVYKGVRRYIERIKDEVLKRGYVETLFGRRRYIQASSENKMQQEAAFRQAINMPVQGASADIIKLAMIAIDHEFEALQLHSRMVLQVHDELVFDIVPNELDRVTKIVREKMENVISLKAPLKISISAGGNWAEIH